MSKEYEVPEELAKLMDKSLACEDLRNRYVKLPFGFRKAKKCAVEFHSLKRKFWNGIRELYPELTGGLSYSANDNMVKIIE